MDIKDIGPIATTLGVAIILISVVALILSQMTPQTYVGTDVTNESHSLALPANLTVTNIDKGVDDGSESLYFWDDSTATMTELSKPGNYTVTSYSNGKFEVEDISAYNKTDGDTINIDYTYLSAGAATGVLSSGSDALLVFADWFGIIVIVAVAAILLGLVRLFRNSAQGAA